VKIDRVENFKDPLNQCTSQNKSWNKTTPHKQQETFEIVQTNTLVENLPEPYLEWVIIVVLLHTGLDSSFNDQILPLIEDLTNSI
jgi:hypothetical protein